MSAHKPSREGPDSSSCHALVGSPPQTYRPTGPGRPTFAFDNSLKPISCPCPNAVQLSGLHRNFRRHSSSRSEQPYTNSYFQPVLI
ncbi:unnamed protein product [Protopolystoma xenopodis]|uniref:Uncharacterized protein n=1 Tax=Protopolystoma xenopodis TaxID=117903 RepID=A0A448XR90_9PLAT|nr:unnamed protein product [Protopolystoma xenopodis]